MSVWRECGDFFSDTWGLWAFLLGLGTCTACPFVLVDHIGGADGHHSCYVIAVEDQKNITWDSTVVYVKTDPQASNEDRYCVTDPKVREMLDAASESKERVVIHYRNDLFLWRWNCNGGCSIIVGVVPADEQKAEAGGTP